DLVAAAFADDGGENLGSGEVGFELALFGADGEDVGELDLAVLVGGSFDLQLLAGGDEVLFAAGADDCVHDENLKRGVVERRPLSSNGLCCMGRVGLEFPQPMRWRHN